MDGLQTYFTRFFVGEDLTCDETSSTCQEVGEGLGAFCLCNHGYHYPIMVLDGAISDRLEQSTKQCFPVDECTGQILGQINPMNNQLGLVSKLNAKNLRFFHDQFWNSLRTNLV